MKSETPPFLILVWPLFLSPRNVEFQHEPTGEAALVLASVVRSLASSLSFLRIFLLYAVHNICGFVLAIFRGRPNICLAKPFGFDLRFYAKSHVFLRFSFLGCFQCTFLHVRAVSPDIRRQFRTAHAELSSAVLFFLPSITASDC